jgi:hypothetical protein
MLTIMGEGMLCGPEQAGDVVALSNCLMNEWNLNYSIYNSLHYGLGAAGVLMPVLATILSDIESKALRRIITGMAAASVSLYAFLNPQEQAATYKSAVNELRHMTALYEQMEKDPLTRVGNANAVILVGAIAQLQEKIVKSEQSTVKDQKQTNRPTQPGASEPEPKP